MGLILVYPNAFSGGASSGATADGHSHSNIATLNKLSTDNNGNLTFNGKTLYPASSVEVVFNTTTTNLKFIELPDDCDTSRAVTFSIEGISARLGSDWRIIEHESPENDVISWDGLGLDGIVQPGDNVSITYYKKL